MSQPKRFSSTALGLETSASSYYTYSVSEYLAVAMPPQDREQLNETLQNITHKYSESRKQKVTKQREVRKKVEATREEKK